MKILYIILLIISAIFYPMYNDNLSFILLLSVLMLPVILLVFLLISVMFIRIKVSSDCITVERGKPVKIRVRITNRSFIPVSCCTITLKYKFNDTIKKFSTSIPLSVKSVESVIINISSTHCGVINCSIKNIKFNDFIGIFSIYKKTCFNESISVLPVIYPYETNVISNMNMDKDSNIFSSSKSGDDPSEVYDLHEYRNGDIQNRIHWKLSSRSDEFIVREFSDPVSSQALLIPDLSLCEKNDEIDSVLDICASFSYFLARKHLEHSMIHFDNTVNIKHIHDVDDYFTVLIDQVKAISYIEKKSEINEYIYDLSVHNKYSHVLYFTNKVNPVALRELELFNLAERISVICLKKSVNHEADEYLKTSEIVIYYTSVENFYEDLKFFVI